MLGGLGEEFVQLVLSASPSSAAGRSSRKEVAKGALSCDSQEPGTKNNIHAPGAPGHSSVESRKRPDDAVSKANWRHRDQYEIVVDVGFMIISKTAVA